MVAFILVLSIVALSAIPVVAEDPDLKPGELVLIPHDLAYASQTIVKYDRDEDGFVDENEQDRIPWRDDLSVFDVDKNKKYSHLEFALRCAAIRAKDGIEQVDYEFAQKDLLRFDLNRNGQLEASEMVPECPIVASEYDKNHDGLVTLREIATQFAFDRHVREELGIMGVDNGGALKLINRYDEDKDRKLDEEEQSKARIETEASAFDNDEDGKMSVLELATMLAKRRMTLGLSKSDQLLARRILKRLDKNKDGLIHWEEYGENGPNPQQLTEFQYFDRDNDRVVTEFEVEKKFGEKRKEKGFDDDSSATARRMLARYDANRDNHLDEAEYTKAKHDKSIPAQSLREIDIDNDKKLSFFEIARFIHRARNKTL